MFANVVVHIAREMPRGGYKLLVLLSKIIPGLRKYPLVLPVAPRVVYQANLANNVFFPLLKHGLYPHQVVEDMVITTFLKDGDVVVDVGANIGYVSLLCATCVGEGDVHSFEPSGVTFEYLKSVASQMKQIKPWQLAVSNFSGCVSFIDETMSDLSHIAANQGQPGHSVQCCTIDDWALTNKISKIDFVKIDAEGHDIHAIEGASKSISMHQPTIEFEAFDTNDVDTVHAILKKVNADSGYQIYRCCNQYPITTLVKSTVAMTNNYFAIPEKRFCDFPRFLFRRGYLILRESP